MHHCTGRPARALVLLKQSNGIGFGLLLAAKKPTCVTTCQPSWLHTTEICPINFPSSPIKKARPAASPAHSYRVSGSSPFGCHSLICFMCFLYKLLGEIWSNGATAFQALTRGDFIVRMLSRLAALFVLVTALFGGSAAIAFEETHLQKLKKLNACEGCDLSGANLARVDLWGANLSGADLSGADLMDAVLRAANLSGANLNGANLREVKMMVADLSGADLSGADLSGADLWNSNLEKAILSGANLSKASLLEANLSEADLSDANLVGAKLRGADLSGANLRGADLTGAIMPNTNMQGAILCKTKLPSGEDNSGC